MGDADAMFISGGEKKAKPKRPAPKPAPMAAQPRPMPTASAKPPSKPQAKPVRKTKKRKHRGVLMRVLTVTAISIGIAALISVIAGVVALYLPGTLVNRGLVPGTFVLVFFLAFLVNLQRQFQIFSMLRSDPKAAAPVSSPMTMQVRPQQFVQDVEFGQVEIEDLRAKIAAEDAEAEGEDQDDMPDELDADMATDVGGGFAEEPKAPAPAEPSPPPQPAAVAKPVEKPAPPSVPKTPEPPAPKPEQKSPGEIEARTGFQKFVAEVMAFAGSLQLNAFSRFGLNLYLAGAASVIGQAKRLARDVQLQVLKDGLQAAGNSPERAESFCVELPTYGKNPKYAGMVQAGVKAMTERMGGSANAASQITALLNDWNLPDKRPSVPSVTTFLFTDIVGSTEMTQRLGNAGAQKAVRAHNGAVRGAIQARGGREVKHTGDGIMATFPDPPSAVAGAIQMQREIAGHNSANPTLQVFVRIGINVGEAVEEDNDFFGAAVQMTARICDKATKGNIWVSQAVVDACKGHRLGFIPRGRFEMKGIQGAKILYEVGWTDAHKNELADL
jgi:class 3 adenylate cyclase